MEDATMRKLTTAVPANNMLQTMKMDSKVKPFGAQFVTRLEGVNSKLVCALSAIRTCADDYPE
jgi:hypothetical protein